VGVSADPQETLDRWAKELRLPYALVGDPDGQLRTAYGVKWPILGLARRVTFLIGRDRRIANVHQAERDVDSHVAAACEFVAGKA
jgi:peroxiredoxin